VEAVAAGNFAMTEMTVEVVENLRRKDIKSIKFTIRSKVDRIERQPFLISFIV
jgi:hypothetical protein